MIGRTLPGVMVLCLCILSDCTRKTKISSCSRKLMDIAHCVNFHTSKMFRIPKPQKNVRLNDCHLKVYLGAHGYMQCAALIHSKKKRREFKLCTWSLYHKMWTMLHVTSSSKRMPLPRKHTPKLHGIWFNVKQAEAIVQFYDLVF